MIEFIDSSIHIKDSILWLDAKRIKEISFLSTFNEEYIKHNRVIATRETSSFLRKFSLSKIPLNILEMPTFKKYSIGNISISLYPSGSNLGNSQITIKRDKKTILYSGIVNINDMKIWEDVYFPITDYLIFKTNYGEKKYQFPDLYTEIGRLKEYILDNYNSEFDTVIFTKSFGISQFIINEIKSLDIPIYLQNRIFNYSNHFKELGVKLGKLRKFNKITTKKSIIIYPFSRIEKFPDLEKKCKRIAITGDIISKKKNNLDDIFIISNEADFKDSIKYIEAISPKKLYLMPGNNSDLIDYFKDKIEVEVFKENSEKRLF